MAVTINGSTGIEYDDNVKHILGNSDDLQIYHDGSHSRIKNTTGYLILNSDTGILLKNEADSESFITCTNNGSVQLAHNGTTKLETTSTGAQLSGTSPELKLTASNSSSASIEFGDTDDDDEAQIWYDNYSKSLSFRTSEASDLLFYRDGTERFKIQSDGARITSDLSLYKTGNTSSTQLHWWGQGVQQYTLYTTQGNIRWWEEVGGDSIIEFQQDGDIKIDGSYLTGGVDYAEYFESTDGSAIAVGTTVVLDNGKVRAATDSETPIGVIRPKTSGTSVTGGSHDLNWQGKYLVDDYDGIIKENATFCTWEQDGEPKQCWKDRPPTGVTIPDDAVETTKSRKKLNPSFDASKTYVPRSERVEWNCVGLLGQIPITKGQPTSTNWIKMKERSSTVELWMVK